MKRRHALLSDALASFLVDEVVVDGGKPASRRLERDLERTARDLFGGSRFRHPPGSRGLSTVAVPTPSGLSGADAAARLERDGPNELVRSRRTRLDVLLGQVRSPLLGLLLAAAVVALAVGERTDGAIILAIMGLSIGLGFFNEYRSEQTLVALRERTGRRATVLRDGVATEVPASELVVDDVCVLQSGDVVPADLRLFEASELAVDEAALTGEAFPAEKHDGDDAALGTVVRSGRGIGVVVATGMRTRLGSIAAGVGERQPPTAFQRGLTSFARMLALVTGVLTVFIFAGNAVLGRPILDALLFSLAIAVGLTPQLLPAIVTVSLSTGARRMAERGVLVKRLVAIEDLGDADVLFTDKTGTLTEGEIRLHAALSADGQPAPELVRLGLLASQLSFVHGAVPLGNALDLAICDSLDAGVARAELEEAKRVAVLPFTFERRRTSVVLEGTHGRRLLCKGAAEGILARCASPPAAAQQTLDALVDKGHRVIAVAERVVPVQPTYTEADERALALDGFLVFADPPKSDAGEAVARLRRLGVELKILTGDSERTTAHVCRQLGVPVKGVARGADLVGLTDADLSSLVTRTTIFARVGPEQESGAGSRFPSATETTWPSSATASTMRSRSIRPTWASRSTQRSMWQGRPPMSSCSRRASAYSRMVSSKDGGSSPTR